MTSARALAVLLLAAAAPAAAQSTATLRGIELYRSASVSLEAVQKTVGLNVQAYHRARVAGTKSGAQSAERLKAQIEGDVRKLGDLAFASLHYGEYVTSADHSAYVVIDVVDGKDAAERMPFRAPSSEKVPDPDGVLSLWRTYAEAGRALMREGKIPTDRPKCPAYFCLWGPVTPELDVFEKRLFAAALTHQGFLRDASVRAAEPSERAAALYVLAYSTGGRAVADQMVAALWDPSAEVRGAALQVLADLALYHPEITIEAPKVIAALDFPTTMERARALAVIVGLAHNPIYLPYVLTRATPRLLALLRLTEPSNHDLAFTLLTTLSKESYGRRDYKAWEAWVATQVSTPAVAAPPPAPKSGH